MRWSLKPEAIPLEKLAELFRSGRKWIDVRAPIEFAEGYLPGAVNLPLLNNEERAAVGTAYKQKGQEAAIELGHQLVSGDIKASRVAAWQRFLQEEPEACFYCFRGGLRSRISQAWTKEAGLDRPLLEGGYKAARNFLLENIATFRHPLLVLSGATGSGKTELIWDLGNKRPCLDLEAIANHRGSAFGNRSTPQPSQSLFENELSVNLLKLKNFLKQPLILEDESRLVGKCVIPTPLFEQLRASPVVLMEVPIEERAQHILKHYVAEPLQHEGPAKVYGNFKFSLGMISRKLGGVSTQEILRDIEAAEEQYLRHMDLQPNLSWITKLLKYYYDPLYLGSLERRQVKVDFRGDRQACFEYLTS